MSSSSLIALVNDVSIEMANTLRESGFTVQQMLTLNRDDLKDLMPGSAKLFERRAVHEVLQVFKENKNPVGANDLSDEVELNDKNNGFVEQAEEDFNNEDSPSSSSSVGDTDSTLHYLSDEATIPNVRGTSPIPREKNIRVTMREQKAKLNFKETQDEKQKPADNHLVPTSSQYVGPLFQLYHDTAVEAANKAGNMPNELRHRVIRSTISMMVSVTTQTPYSRYPLNCELEEMSKSLVIKYSTLRDPVTNHGKLFKQLKDRLRNTKPIKRPRKMKRIDVDGHLADGEETEGIESPDSSMTEPMNEKLLTLLTNETRKRNPDEKTITSLLKQEFQYRRNWIVNSNSLKRVENVLNKYECFKNYIHIVDEAKLLIDDKTPHFLEDCLENLRNQIETMIYFGMKKRSLPPPKQGEDQKLLHILRNVGKIFPTRKPGRGNGDLVVDIKTCPNAIKHECIKIEKNNYVIFIKGIMVCQCPDILTAVVTFLSSFYLMDIEYPTHLMVAFHILQWIVLKDRKAPPHIFKELDNVYGEYTKFKLDSV